MTRHQWMRLLLLLALAAALSGCSARADFDLGDVDLRLESSGIGVRSSREWRIEITAYELRNAVRTDVPLADTDDSQLTFHADPGRHWLLVHLDLDYKGSDEHCLSDEGSRFTFVAAGNRVAYPRNDALTVVPDHLPDCLTPGDTYEGFVGFEIDVSTDVRAGHLIFDPRPGEPMRVSLQRVPRL